jgi:hypothetical protein
MHIFFSCQCRRNFKVKTKFLVSLDNGSGGFINKKPGYDIPFEKEWLETVDGGIKVSYKLTPSLTGRLNLGAVVNVATVSPRERGPLNTQQRR